MIRGTWSLAPSHFFLTRGPPRNENQNLGFGGLLILISLFLRDKNHSNILVQLDQNQLNSSCIRSLFLKDFISKNTIFCDCSANPDKTHHITGNNRTKSRQNRWTAFKIFHFAKKDINVRESSENRIIDFEEAQNRIKIIIHYMVKHILTS